jgi:glycerol-3-phosphate acyltransferase PlsY
MLAAVPTSVAILLVGIVGYLLGSFTVANQVARRHGIDDLRATGDRNPGFWNTKEQIGARAALPVFGVDVTKGALAAGYGTLLATNGPWWLPYLGGGAAMVGHAWPVFAGLRGGRSVLTFVGAALVFAPAPAFAAVALLASVWAVSRHFAWAVRAGIAAFPVLQILLEGPRRTALTGILMTFIGVRFLQARLHRDVLHARPGAQTGPDGRPDVGPDTR